MLRALRFVFVVLFLATPSLVAQTTWSGAVSNAWNLAANWSAGVPNAGTAAIIAPAANQPSTVGVIAPTCGGLTIQPGASLAAPLPAALNVVGSVAVSGLVTGEIRLTGGGSIATPGAGQLGDVLILGGAYTATGAAIAGRLETAPTAGALTVQNLTIGAFLNLFGAGLVGLPASSLSVQGGINLQSPVPITTPPTTIVVNSSWTSNASWQPSSGTVFLAGNATAVNIAPGTVFRDVEAEPTFGVVWSDDLRVAGALRMRGDIQVQGTTIDITQRLTMTFDASLSGGSVTLLRLRNGVTSAGFISLTNATLDVDGDVTFFVSGSLHLGAGAHTVSNSFGLPGFLSAAPGASFLFDGAGTIVLAPNNVIPNVTITGSYTIRTAHIVGNLVQMPGAGSLGIGRCIVDGSCTFQGATVVDDGVGSLDVAGDIVWQTTGVSTTPPATIFCAGNWTSNGNFQPASGLVVFDGLGPKTVTTPAFSWRSLRVAASAQVSTNLPVLTTGTLDVQGTLSTTGNDVEVFGALTVSGVLSAGSSLRLRTHSGATVSGQVLAGGARLDDDGDVTVTGTMTLGAGPHEISGSTRVSGALNIPVLQVLRFDGTGIVDIVVSSPIPNVEFVGGDHDVESLVVGRDLSQQSGTLRVRTCLVQRDATLQGTNVVDLGVGLLDVRRNLAVQLAAAVTAPPATIRCGGNWTSTATFAPASGLVQFDGPAGQSVVAAPTTWHDVRVAIGSVAAMAQDLATSGFVDVRGKLQVAGTNVQIGDRLVVVPGGIFSSLSATTVAVAGQVVIAGSMQAPLAALAAASDVTCDIGGTLTLGAGPHTFQATLDVQGPLTVPPTADFQFLGDCSVSIPPSSGIVPTVLFGGVSCKVNQLEVQGLVRHTAGRLTVTSLVGHGAALFQGTSVDGGPGDLIDIGGNVVFGTTGVVVTPPGTIRCGGSWASNAQFLPTSGTVEMVGTGPVTMATSAQLFLSSLFVAAPTQLTIPTTDVILQRDLSIDGTLNAPTNLLEIRRDLTVAATGSLVLPVGHVCSVTRDVSNLGSIGPNGTLRMVGIGSLAGAGQFPIVAIDSVGEVQCNGAMTLAANLLLTTGTLRLGAAAQVHVLGNLIGSGGAIRGPAGALLDVDGSIALGTVVAHPAGMPDVHCAGDYVADAAFAPTSGTVLLDGPGRLASTFGPLHFAHLQVGSGARTLDANLICDALDVVIQAGASLQIGGHELRLTAASIGVGGDLAIDAGGLLFLGAGSALQVVAGGRLAMLGVDGDPARLDGPVGGGYSVTIDGTVEAVNFTCAHMGPAGIRVNAGATIAPAPRDLRGGRFSGADPAPGSCLLHIDRSAPAQLRYATFVDSGTATFNVRSTGTAAVGIVNDEGNFTGPTHENDPGNRVDWLPAEHTQVTRFTSDAAVHRVELVLTTTAEFDVQQLHLSRSESPTGPFAPILGSPFAATGSPTLGAAYATTDFAVIDTRRYFYRLEEELTHGPRRLLGSDFARPWPQQISTLWFVGTNGGYPDIAAAVAAAPPGANIFVQAGTYPAFTMNKAVRIAPDGSGPVRIDTTLGKFVVRDIPANATWVELFDLEIGTPTSGFGMEIVNCDNTIVLDGLQVATAAGVTGLLVDDTAHIAIQNCSIAGDPGLRFTNSALGYLSRGSVDELDVLGASDVTRCDVVPTSQTVGVGSIVTARAGGMPALLHPIAWVGDKPRQVTLQADANSLYSLFFSFGRDFFQIGDVFPFIDMVLLIEQTQAQLMLTGVLPTGSETFTIPANGDPAFWGLAITGQLYELKTGGQGRLSTSRTAIFVP